MLPPALAEDGMGVAVGMRVGVGVKVGSGVGVGGGANPPIKISRELLMTPYHAMWSPETKAYSSELGWVVIWVVT